MSLAVFFPDLFLKIILGFLNDPAIMRSRTAWLIVVLIAVAGALAGAAECQCNWIGGQISVQLRAILINLLYRKVLRLRQAWATPFKNARGRAMWMRGRSQI